MNYVIGDAAANFHGFSRYCHDERCPFNEDGNYDELIMPWEDRRTAVEDGRFLET